MKYFAKLLLYRAPKELCILSFMRMYFRCGDGSSKQLIQQKTNLINCIQKFTHRELRDSNFLERVASNLLANLKQNSSWHGLQ